jgi:hypothetical protein
MLLHTFKTWLLAGKTVFVVFIRKSFCRDYSVSEKHISCSPLYFRYPLSVGFSYSQITYVLIWAYYFRPIIALEQVALQFPVLEIRVSNLSGETPSL